MNAGLLVSWWNGCVSVSQRLLSAVVLNRAAAPRRFSSRNQPLSPTVAVCWSGGARRQTDCQRSEARSTPARSSDKCYFCFLSGWGGTGRSSRCSHYQHYLMALKAPAHYTTFLPPRWFHSSLCGSTAGTLTAGPCGLMLSGVYVSCVWVGFSACVWCWVPGSVFVCTLTCVFVSTNRDQEGQISSMLGGLSASPGMIVEDDIEFADNYISLNALGAM